jgi:hypothetical protein
LGTGSFITPSPQETKDMHINETIENEQVGDQGELRLQ